MAIMRESVGKDGEGLYSGERHLVFHCPGCDYGHMFIVRDDKSKHPNWNWNGRMDKPTFSPSLLYKKDEGTKQCHLYVTDGYIQFLTDCEHHLAGRTVPMVEW